MDKYRLYRLHVQLNRDDPQDRVVIAALERLGARGKSRWVRRVLFDAVTGPARAELLEEIRAVGEAVRRIGEKGVIMSTGQDDKASDDEPEAARRGLEAMKSRFRDLEG